MLIETIEAGALGEGAYGSALAEIAKAHAGASIGSYPSFADGKFSNQIVVRAKDAAVLDAAAAEVRAMVTTLSAFRAAQ
jgi:hypothetical protein